jgi:hypothetical protein
MRMTAQASSFRGMLAISAVVAIWFVVLAIVPRQYPPVAAAGALDLTCTAGAAMYFLAVRRGHLPRWMLTVTIAAGVMGARFILHGGGALTLVVLGMIELAAMTFAIRRIRRGQAGIFGHIIAAELQVMASAVRGWRRPLRAPNVFTSHRTNGWALFAGTLIGLTLIETPLVHVVLTRFDHPTIAWMATGASLYSVAWLIGDLHALRHGGLIVTPEALEIRLGVRWRGTIPRTQIANITRCHEAPSRDVDFSILGANVLVTLRTPVEMRGLFGRRRHVDMLAVSVDDTDQFEQAMH